eukprot:TRINITY_DN35144_c0_g1_i1.p2 TRINITY_DN35144_c0_g1~~TRINITY_DN35144_c0_g1_i1.p2  ORF type:complete len:621 (+),score=175.10 TRINITY_DN35144_c0_g1_i1:87-1865(+)
MAAALRRAAADELRRGQGELAARLCRARRGARFAGRQRGAPQGCSSAGGRRAGHSAHLLHRPRRLYSAAAAEDTEDADDVADAVFDAIQQSEMSYEEDDARTARRVREVLAEWSPPTGAAPQGRPVRWASPPAAAEAEPAPPPAAPAPADETLDLPEGSRPLEEGLRLAASRAHAGAGHAREAATAYCRLRALRAAAAQCDCDNFQPCARALHDALLALALCRLAVLSPTSTFPAHRPLVEVFEFVHFFTRRLGPLPAPREVTLRDGVSVFYQHEEREREARARFPPPQEFREPLARLSRAARAASVSRQEFEGLWGELADPLRTLAAAAVRHALAEEAARGGLKVHRAAPIAVPACAGLSAAAQRRPAFFGAPGASGGAAAQGTCGGAMPDLRDAELARLLSRLQGSWGNARVATMSGGKEVEQDWGSIFVNSKKVSRLSGSVRDAGSLRREQGALIYEWRPEGGRKFVGFAFPEYWHAEQEIDSGKVRQVQQLFRVVWHALDTAEGAIVRISWDGTSDLGAIEAADLDNTDQEEEEDTTYIRVKSAAKPSARATRQRSAAPVEGQAPTPAQLQDGGVEDYAPAIEDFDTF